MFKNYFKTAYRYLLNNKWYSLINIVGLSLGFFCFLLLNFYVVSENSFDKDLDNVYRLLQEENMESNSRQMATIGPRVGSAAMENFPEIKDHTKLMVLGRLTVGNDPANRQYEQMTTIDSSFFKIFNIEFVEGTPENVLNQANGIVLTKSKAEKYFGKEPALNKTLYTNLATCVVAGVIEDFPSNSHLYADLIIPEQTAAANFGWWTDFISNNWHRNASVTYFKVTPQADVENLGQKITELAEENWPNENEFKSNFFLQSAKDIHLYQEEVEGEINQSKGNALYVKIFFWIGLVVILVACFNYTGLLNVAYMNRTKEIGVRKVIGAGRKQLIFQFFVESLLLTSIALVIAIAFLLIFRNLIINLLGTGFDWTYISGTSIAMLLAVALLISIVSVAYPTFVISRKTPVNALKEQNRRKTGFSLQKSILTFQFIASITLIACSFLFHRQVKHIQNKELGFNPEGIVTVDINSGVLRGLFEAIKNEFKSLPEVQDVSVMSRVPGEWKNFPIVGVSGPKQRTEVPSEMIFMGADKDFISTYDISLLNGANFAGNPSDSTKVLINETAAAALKMDNPVGKFIEIPTVNWNGDNNPLEQPFKAQIAGVVKDFHFEDFHQIIRPMVIGNWNNPIHSIDYYSIKLKTDDWAGTIASLKEINDTFDPDNPMEFYVLNDKFRRFFEADILRSRLLIFFTGIIILISFMGLFTITAFVLKHRTKEIGIRKVLGATPTDLVRLISKDFLSLVLIGSAVAIPLSFLIISNWLDEFAYRLPLHWSFFIGAALVIFMIAFITVSMQTLKISLSNPVNSLRTE